MINFRERRIVKKISKSTIDFEKMLNVEKGINCYAFARSLSYLDENREFYTPGMLYYMVKEGQQAAEEKLEEELFLVDSYNKSFFDKMDKYIQLDSIAIKQPVKRISFSEIKENDGFQYFGMSIFKEYGEWHFICRNPKNNIWFHKPGWKYSPEPVEWIEYGKEFMVYGHRAKCCKNFFYRIEK